MTPPPNPYTPGTYEHQYYDARVHEMESARDRYDLVLGDAPETAHMVKTINQRLADEVEPSHGHMSIRTREDLRLREIRAAIAQENRGGMRLPDPEPEWAQVYVDHPRGGMLRLRSDGTGWFLHNRGVDFGVGSVARGEFTDHGLKPRPEVIEAAAERALADPWGPESPPGTPMFRGGPDGEPVEVTADDLNAAAPDTELGVIERFRRRLADRKGNSDD